MPVTISDRYPFLVVSHDVLDAELRTISPGRAVSRHSRRDLARKALSSAVRGGLLVPSANVCRIVNNPERIERPVDEATAAWWVGGARQTSSRGGFTFKKIAVAYHGLPLRVMAPRPDAKAS
jgi:hypothetical protein